VSRPTVKVLALLEILQGGGTRTAADLAARLAVDERTLRRYAGHLADLGIPVQSVRGRHGGYRLAPGHRMPPLMLSDDEALAVLLGLVAGRRAGLVTTSAAAVESAAAKVRRVLPAALGRRLDALLQTTDFTVPGRPVVEMEPAVLLRLAEAAHDRRPVALTYTDAEGRRSERTVHPYGVVAHSGRWYITGADSTSGAVRTFRLDRITTAELGAGTFDVPDGFGPADRVLSGIAAAPRRHEVLLRVQGAAEQVRYRFPAGIASVDDGPDGDGWVRVRLRVEELDWVPAVLVGLGLPFAVDQPVALQELLRSLAARLTAAAGDGAARTEDPASATQVVGSNPR
jgi:predicted DNA-binding transcriptional regulator YafY